MNCAASPNLTMALRKNKASSVAPSTTHSVKPRQSQESSGGVDLGLIRTMLEMTPQERLATLDDFVTFVESARRGTHA